MPNKSESRPKQAKKVKHMLVRYGRMNCLGFFEHSESRLPKVETQVVVKTSKGLELGKLVGQLTCYRGGQFKLNAEQTKEYFGRSDIDMPVERGGKFIRFATPDDISEQEHLQRISKDEIQYCRRTVKELRLPMKIVDAEHILGGERLLFYFMAEGRVDFRELVKKLAHEYQTRIEMRQIGSRDEAKLLGDLESCGQECCCRRFLKLLKPVNMRMAKMQKATLDPSKISGYCGRLKCCLRYEDKTYTELKKRLPRKSTRVSTTHGEGKIVNTQIITQLVVVELDSGNRVAVGVDEIEIQPSNQGPKKKREDTPKDKQQDEAASDKSKGRVSRGRRRSDSSKGKRQDRRSNKPKKKPEN